MKCFFGHKWAKILEDGWQYCIHCGKGRKPHPCEAGHMWVDFGKETYNETTYSGTVTRLKFYQTCKVCGEHRSTWD